MVKIVRGDHKTKVTMVAYENIFKPLGYTLVEEKKKREIPKVKDTEPVKDTELVNEAKGKGKKQED